MKEYKTTTGEVCYTPTANAIEHVDDPIEPEGEGWKLVGSTLTELRYSTQTILWFWERG